MSVFLCITTDTAQHRAAGDFHAVRLGQDFEINMVAVIQIVLLEKNPQRAGVLQFHCSPQFRTNLNPTRPSARPIKRPAHRTVEPRLHLHSTRKSARASTRAEIVAAHVRHGAGVDVRASWLSSTNWWSTMNRRSARAHAARLCCWTGCRPRWSCSNWSWPCFRWRRSNRNCSCR